MQIYKYIMKMHIIYHLIEVLEHYEVPSAKYLTTAKRQCKHNIYCWLLSQPTIYLKANQNVSISFHWLIFPQLPSHEGISLAGQDWLDLLLNAEIDQRSLWVRWGSLAFFLFLYSISHDSYQIICHFSNFSP